MKEHPIIFSTELIPRILDGIKTQTRRVILARHNVSKNYKKPPSNKAVSFSQSMNPQCWIEKLPLDMTALYPNSKPSTINGDSFRCPYGQVGDRLWVREAWATEKRLDKFSGSELGDAGDVALWYKSGEIPSVSLERGRWRTSRFMPRWASRILLEITEVRVERVQDIWIKDAIAEGCSLDYDMAHFFNYTDPISQFRALWDSLNAKRKRRLTKYDREILGLTKPIIPSYEWASNPWVWVITFKVVK